MKKIQGYFIFLFLVLITPLGMGVYTNSDEWTIDPTSVSISDGFDKWNSGNSVRVRYIVYSQESDGAGWATAGEKTFTKSSTSATFSFNPSSTYNLYSVEGHFGHRYSDIDAPLKIYVNVEYQKTDVTETTTTTWVCVLWGFGRCLIGYPVFTTITSVQTFWAPVGSTTLYYYQNPNSASTNGNLDFAINGAGGSIDIKFSITQESA